MGGLDLELHFGMPSTPITYDFVQNVDLTVFADPIPMEAITVFADPIPVENFTFAEVEEGNKNDVAIIVYEGLVGGYDAVTGVGELGVLSPAARTAIILESAKEIQSLETVQLTNEAK